MSTICDFCRRQKMCMSFDENLDSCKVERRCFYDPRLKNLFEKKDNVFDVMNLMAMHKKEISDLEHANYVLRKRLSVIENIIKGGE